MMSSRIFILWTALMISAVHAKSQTHDSDHKKYFVGSTLFVLANLLPDPPHYYQLNLGYRWSAKDVIAAEVITWTYQGPLGRPYGKDHENPAQITPVKYKP